MDINKRPKNNKEINKESISIEISNGTPTDINNFVYSFAYIKNKGKLEYNYSLNDEIPIDNCIMDINNKNDTETNAAYYRNKNDLNDGTINGLEKNNGVSTETEKFIYNEGIKETEQYKPNLSNSKNDYKIKKGTFFSINAEQYNGTNDLVIIRNL